MKNRLFPELARLDICSIPWSRHLKVGLTCVLAQSG